MRWNAGLALVMGLVGCGEPALCTSDFRLALQAPATLTVDFDPISDGVQMPVTVDSSMAAGEHVQLDVLDNTGAIVSTTVGTVDAAGIARFDMVTLPPPLATLRASAHDVCGAQTNEQKIDVLAGAHCDLAFVTTPVMNPFYAPLGVLDVATDTDPAAAGEQAVVSVATRLGWTVALHERSGVFGDEDVGYAIQGAPISTSSATFRDGMTSLFATCSQPPVTLTSAALFVFVDASAPMCAIEEPVVNGGTLEISAVVTETDSEGEPAHLTVTPVGGSPIDAGATPIAGRHTHGSVPAPSGAVDIVFSTQDHAHNACSVTARF